ncbi:protein STPG4 isoform X1 [Amia ocellicauda]|uniref:protein STPG4 isoform X1 n=1 Tax=Amia ocellicauda TaxID=2972642 RepID=UPI003464440C
MTAAHRRAGAAERGGRVGVGVGVGVGTSRNKDSEKELVSERESWWRSTIKDSPDPGSYHVRDFLEEAQLNPVKMTYNFRGKGRERPAGWLPSGGLLLPGAYNHRDFLQRTEKRPASYSFKNSPRPDCYTLGIRDKDIDVSPCAYNIVDDPVPKLPCKHAMFRSAVQRETFLPVSVKLTAVICARERRLKMNIQAAMFEELLPDAGLPPPSLTCSRLEGGTGSGAVQCLQGHQPVRRHFLFPVSCASDGGPSLKNPGPRDLRAVPADRPAPGDGSHHGPGARPLLPQCVRLLKEPQPWSESTGVWWTRCTY